MINLLNKIFKIDFNILSQDGRLFFNDYIIADKLFNLDSIPIETDDKLHEYLITIFSGIIKQTRVELNILYTKSNDISKWFHLLTDKQIDLDLEKYLINKFNKIFEEEVKFHKINEKSNNLKHFLSARINHRFYYIITSFQQINSIIIIQK